MPVSKNGERNAREARDRLRRYTARQSVHSLQVNRRRRDNIIAIVGVIVVVGLATLTQVVYFTAGPGTPAPSSHPARSASPSPSPSVSAAAETNVGDVPSSTIAEGRTWTGDLTLNGVKLGISLDGVKAPQAASVFISLAKKHFYTTSGANCFRLTTTAPLHILQCGSPDGTASGNIGFSYGPIENAPSGGSYPAGTIAMARASSLYSQGSQFFIVYKGSTLAPSGGGYTIFGTITSGLDEYVSTIAEKGVTGGATDGTPTIATKITQLSVQ